MLDNILNWLFGLKIVRLFKVNTTPRWVILLIDMLIVDIHFPVLGDIHPVPGSGDDPLRGCAGFVIFAGSSGQG